MSSDIDDRNGNFSTQVSVFSTPGASLDNNSNETFVDIFMEQIAMTLNIYYTPVLIVLGCLGNLLSIVVFFNSKLRLQSTSQYLSALALSDTLFLCQLLPPWLKAVGASTLFSRDGYCQLFVYLSYVTCNHSSWLVVAFTIERFVAVVYPLRRNAMCTVTRARYIIGSLAVASLLINVPVLRFALPNDNDCNIDELLMNHAARFNMIDTVVSFTMPMALIVVLNAWIMWGVYRVGRARRDLMRQQDPEEAPQTPRLGRTTSSQRSQQRVTRMLLFVSSVFVLLNLPAYTMRIVAYANNMDEHEYSGKWAAVQQVCLLFFNTNFGINFVLYCMTGQNFRRALQETFPWLVRRKLARLILRANATDQPVRASSVSTSFAHSFSNNQTEATSHGAGSSSMAYHMARRCGASHAVAGPSGVERYVSRRPGRVEYTTQTFRINQEERVIQRWRFDNSRQLGRGSAQQQQHQESIELHDFTASRGNI